jgi:hypothetical protein
MAVFNFTGTIDHPSSAYLIINKKGTGINTNAISYISMFLESGKKHCHHYIRRDK